MKKIIRLTESDLHNIVKKSVNKILKETVMGDMSFDERIVEKIADDIMTNGCDFNGCTTSFIMNKYACSPTVAKEVRKRLVNNKLFDKHMKQF